MTMQDLRRGERAVVLKVDLPVLLKERLRSLGVFTGAKLSVLKVSGKKNVRLIQVGSAKIVLDGETAAGIRIWKI
ncbi:MAG: ferrous iron transport protein A [Clostridia bacterium]|nr:ferrous iron transport protein A [Clostridia bacterium]